MTYWVVRFRTWRIRTPRVRNRRPAQLVRPNHPEIDLGVTAVRRRLRTIQLLPSPPDRRSAAHASSPPPPLITFRDPGPAGESEARSSQHPSALFRRCLRPSERVAARSVPSKSPPGALGGGFDGTERTGAHSDSCKQGRISADGCCEDRASDGPFGHQLTSLSCLPAPAGVSRPRYAAGRPAPGRRFSAIHHQRTNELHLQRGATAAPGRVRADISTDPGYMSRQIRKFRTINSKVKQTEAVTRATHVNGWTEFLCSSLSNYSAHVSCVLSRDRTYQWA